MKKLFFLNKLGPFWGLLLIVGLFALIGPQNFISVQNLELILRQVTIVGIAALGMTLVIISGGIDLSVGSLVALNSVLIAKLLFWWTPNPSGGLLFDVNSPFGVALAAAVCAMLLCSAMGLLNGWMIARLRIVPFIVTLGSLLIVRGISKGVAHEQKVNAPLSWLNDLLAPGLPGKFGSIAPPGVWTLFMLLLVVWVFLKYTRTGRHIYAIGSNEQTARLCGVAVTKIKILVYTLSAVFASLAGVMQFARLSVGDPTVAVGLELDVIAAVVIGGGSLSGGEGSVLGSFIGALIMTVIRAGCSQMGLPNWIQEIIAGIIIIVAVTIDRLRQGNKK